MVKNCPYCDKVTNAVKNHVRLAGGNGHGPAGKYPDEFDGDADEDDPTDVESEQEPSEDVDESSGESGEVEDEEDEETARVSAESSSGESLVWYAGAALVALFLWLTGQNETGGQNEQGEMGPDVV